MERDIAGRGRDQHRTARRSAVFDRDEPLPDAEGHRTHRREGGVLHQDKDQGVEEKQEAGEKTTIGSNDPGAGPPGPTPGTAHEELPEGLT